MLLRAGTSCLLVVDFQTRLAPAVAQADAAIANAGVVMRAANRLGVPMLVTEQYPGGLGHTVPELTALAPERSVIEKIEFSCTGNEVFLSRLRGLDRSQVVILGMEAHVCVMQTALLLLEDGLDVFVVADAVSSRRPENRAMALERIRDAGGDVVTTEMVVFEWLERAGTPVFREMLALIK